jgi:hypothetical protein
MDSLDVVRASRTILEDTIATNADDYSKCNTKREREACKRANTTRLLRQTEIWNGERRVAFEAMKRVHWENMTVLSWGLDNFVKELASPTILDVIPLGHGWRDYLRGIITEVMQDEVIVRKDESYAKQTHEYYDWWATRDEYWMHVAQQRRTQEDAEIAEYARAQEEPLAREEPAATPQKKTGGNLSSPVPEREDGPSTSPPGCTSRKSGSGGNPQNQEERKESDKVRAAMIKEREKLTALLESLDAIGRRAAMEGDPTADKQVIQEEATILETTISDQEAWKVSDNKFWGNYLARITQYTMLFQ